ncbi:FAS1 domain-containing protein [Cercophora newfieldiana]|uniref:FAS1 domain-containing protein n=1 Tax=Cercophora newfieldiana TaxID=92897 RepID=A0AA39YBP8_9PEZI|nr:FAS1 domain-containing protein [Cercophora newfieldiana]
MAGKFFALLTLFIVGSLAQSQSLLAVLRREGFTEYAAFLEGGAGVKILNSPTHLLIYAPTNAGFLRYKQSPNVARRAISEEQAEADYQSVPTNPGDVPKRKRTAVCSDVAGSGATDLMTLLDNPNFVNLPPNNNASIVQKNMPKGALPVVHSGLGDVIKVTGLDIPYDKGVIRPVSGLFTLPRLLSKTLPFIGADKTLNILKRTGLIDDLDNRTGITFLAPDSSAIPSDLPDSVLAEILKRHVIVGLPVFTSDLKHGATYKTLAGTTVTVTVQCAEIFIGGARVLAGDAIIKNGVAHTVDKLLETPIFFTTTEVKTEVKTVTETATKTDIHTAEVTKTAIHTTEKTQTTTHTEEIVKTTTQTAETTKVHTTEKTKTQTETHVETTTHIQHPPPKPSTPCTTSTTYVPPPPPPPPPKTSTPCTTTTTQPPPPPPTQYTTLQTSHKPPKPHGPPPEVSTPCTTSTTKPGYY